MGDRRKRASFGVGIASGVAVGLGALTILSTALTRPHYSGPCMDCEPDDTVLFVSIGTAAAEGALLLHFAAAGIAARSAANSELDLASRFQQRLNLEHLDEEHAARLFGSFRDELAAEAHENKVVGGGLLIASGFSVACVLTAAVIALGGNAGAGYAGAVCGSIGMVTGASGSAVYAAGADEQSLVDASAMEPAQARRSVAIRWSRAF